jgi:hypothetical protein
MYSNGINIFSLLVPTVLSPALMSTTSLFYGVKMVAQNSLLQKEFSEYQRATMGSLNSFGGSILLALFSFFLGLTADALSPVKGLLIFQIGSFLPFWLFIQILRNQRKNTQPSLRV